MKQTSSIMTGLAVAGLVWAGSIARAETNEAVTTYETDAAFSDVMSDLEDAIVNRGFVVDHHGYIAEMLKRTAQDVGAAKPLYREAEFLQFCSAVVSRAAMEADIGNIAFCPYVLFAYEAEASPGKVVVGFRRLPQGEARDTVNELLDEVAREAAGQ